MVVQINSLRLLKFGRKAIKKNKALVESVGVLHKTVSKVQASRALSKKGFSKLKR